MINCIILDDEPLAINLLASYVDNVTYLTCLKTFTNPLEAMQFVRNNSVDLAFLDIQMPQLSGVDLARIISDDTKVIFTTAYPDYALEGFELNAVDYLVKPISFSRFISAVDRLKDDSRMVYSSSETKEFIFVKTEYRLQKIDTNEIYFLKGTGDYCTIYTEKGKVMTLENLKSLTHRLSSTRFTRVHKSYTVAIDKVNYIKKNRIYIDEEIIPIGKTYEEDFRKYLR